MIKRIRCEKCGKRFKIEGPTQGDHEVPIRVPCPFCKHENQVNWPSGAAYSVTPDDGT